MYRTLIRAAGVCVLLLVVQSNSILSAQTDPPPPEKPPELKQNDQPIQQTAEELAKQEKKTVENQTDDKAAPKVWTRPMGTERASLDLNKIKLPGAVKKELQRVTLPALESGNLEVFYPSVLKLLAKLDADELDRVEKFGKLSIGESIKAKYVELKLKSIESGMPQGSEASRLGAISILVTDLVDQVDSKLVELDGHTVMQDPLTLPATWRERDELFWDTHVFENRLLNAGRLAQYGYAEAMQFIQKANPEDEEDTIRELRQIEPLPKEVQRRLKDMMEREAELRIEELKLAVETLKNEKDFEQRLNAAFALQTNTDNLESFFAETKAGTYERAKLAAPTLIADVKKLVTEGREAGKDIIEKAMLLRIGAHWWLRGRYGSGPLANGLLKHKNAVNSEQVMFGLYMPIKRPEAIGTYGDEGYAPGYDRRHFYTWAVEYRGRYGGNTVGKQYTTERETLAVNSTNTKNHSFW